MLIIFNKNNVCMRVSRTCHLHLIMNEDGRTQIEHLKKIYFYNFSLARFRDWTNLKAAVFAKTYANCKTTAASGIPQRKTRKKVSKSIDNCLPASQSLKSSPFGS